MENEWHNAKRATVAIIGGGIAGLAALEELTRVAPALDVVLLEANDRVGGHIRTEVHDGFIVETGPDVVLAAKPAAVDLAQRAGLGERLQPTNPAAKGSYIFDGRGLRRIPQGMTGLVPSRMAPFITTRLLSPWGKLRVALEYFVPPRFDETDESIESFVVRRLGREMYERLVEPLLSGISAGDGSRLSIGAMFPQLRQMERTHGSLARGVLADRKQRRHAARPVRSDGGVRAGAAFLSFPKGLGELVDGVRREIERRDAERRRRGGGGAPSIRTGWRATGFEWRGAGYVVTGAAGERIEADALILATPAFVTASLVRPLDAELSVLLDGIDYASTVTVSVAYARSEVRRALDATGYIVPRALGRRVLACTWVSSKFLHRAPDHRALFRLFLGGAGRGSFVASTDDELANVVSEEMREVMSVTAQPVLRRIDRYHQAMPQYVVGHLERVARIEQAVARLDGGRCAVAGAAYHGIGIPDCIRSGRRAAERVLERLSARAPAGGGVRA